MDGERKRLARAPLVIAVVSRNTNLLGVRTPSRLEISYLQTAAELRSAVSRFSY